MLVAQKIEIPQKLKDELIKNNLPIPNYKNSNVSYEQLLNSASYSLPTNTYSGITLKYCFDNKLYDVYDVNNLIYTLTDKEIKDL